MKVTSDRKGSVVKHFRTLEVEDGPTIPAGDNYVDGCQQIVDRIRIEWQNDSKALSVRVRGFIVSKDGTVTTHRPEQGFTRRLGFPDWLEKFVKDHNLYV